MCRAGVATAVCWDGKSYVNKHKAGAWCTYKTVSVDKCDEHAPNPARMYACSASVAAPAAKTPEPSKPSEAEKTCADLLAQAKQWMAQNDRQTLAGIDAKLRGVCPPQCLSALAVPAGQPRPACLDDDKAVIGFVSAKPPSPSPSNPPPTPQVTSARPSPMRPAQPAASADGSCRPPGSRRRLWRRRVGLKQKFNVRSSRSDLR